MKKITKFKKFSFLVDILHMISCISHLSFFKIEIYIINLVCNIVYVSFDIIVKWCDYNTTLIFDYIHMTKWIIKYLSEKKKNPFDFMVKCVRFSEIHPSKDVTHHYGSWLFWDVFFSRDEGLTVMYTNTTVMRWFVQLNTHSLILMDEALVHWSVLVVH